MFARIKNKNFSRYEKSLKKKDYYISKIDRKEKSFWILIKNLLCRLYRAILCAYRFFQTSHQLLGAAISNN